MAFRWSRRVAVLQRRAVPWVAPVPRRAGAAGLALAVGVAVWWLLIFGTIVATVPLPDVAILAGHTVRLSVPSRTTWLLPTDRVNYEDYHRALLGHEDAMNVVLARSGWIDVTHGQSARVIHVDQNAALIELLEDPNAGSQGWLKLDHLRGATSTP